MYSLNKNFSSKLTMLSSRSKDCLTKYLTAGMRSPVLSYWPGLFRRLPKIKAIAIAFVYSPRGGR